MVASNEQDVFRSPIPNHQQAKVTSHPTNTKEKWKGKSLDNGVKPDGVVLKAITLNPEPLLYRSPHMLSVGNGCDDPTP